MTKRYDVIVIGAGHNGLVTAAYLARSGLHVLVLEQRDAIGGAAATEAIHPGFRVDTVAHRLGWNDSIIVRDLNLKRHGLEILRTEPFRLSLLSAGDSLTLWSDRSKTVDSIRALSDQDAESWPAFCEQIRTLTELLRSLYTATPIPVPHVGAGDLGFLLKLGRKLRRLGGQQMSEVLRVPPMSVAEFLDEWFESEALKGIIGSLGISGIFQGPYAAGTTLVLLHQFVTGNRFPSSYTARGGIGAFASSLAAAATSHGATIQTSAPVANITVKDDSTAGVTLQDGTECAATRVVSNADPHRTFLEMLDPTDLDPEFVWHVRNIKFRGARAKMHFALDGVPNFSRNGDRQTLTGVLSISPSLEYLERAYDDAKYGGISAHPYLEVVIPSLVDSSLAPAGKHVMSVAMQYAPYRLATATWNEASKNRLADLIIQTLSQYAPDLSSLVIHHHLLTPVDLERQYGLPEGNGSHGELTLDQLFFMRPVPGWAQYRTPIRNLYLCGAGTHPGGGVTGLPGYNAAREILKDVKKDGKGR